MGDRCTVAGVGLDFAPPVRSAPEAERSDVRGLRLVRDASKLFATFRRSVHAAERRTELALLNRALRSADSLVRTARCPDKRCPVRARTVEIADNYGVSARATLARNVH